MKLLCRKLELHLGTFQLQLNLDLSGQVFGIFGGSGAGKTSFLEVLAGLRQPHSGLIQLDDLILLDQSRGFFLPPEKRAIGYLPQDLALFPHLSVRQNLLYGAKPTSSHPATELITLSHVVEVLEIGSLLDRPVTQLSGGQQQRVALARALMSSPQLLLMDEPLASLDQELKSKVLPYLQRIRDEFKIPMVYVSHSPDEIQALCQQVIVLRNGTVLFVGSPSEIFVPTTSLRVKAEYGIGLA